MDKDQFKQALRRLEWTQAKAAAELGTTQKTISFWCTGKHPVAPWAVKLLKLIEQQADQADRPLYEQLVQMAQTNERYARRIEELETTQRNGADDVKMYRIEAQRARREATQARQELDSVRQRLKGVELTKSALELLVSSLERDLYAAQHARVDWSAYEPYFTLGIRPDSTPAQIKRARNELATVFHPDKGGSVERQQRINAAYDNIKQSW